MKQRPRAWVSDPAPFRSVFGLRSAHLQTILGPYLPGKQLTGTVSYMVPLEDGDTVAVHFDAPPLFFGSGPIEERPVVVSVHGLAGCHGSRYMQRLAWHALQQGWASYRMDMRGAGVSGLQSRFLYHAGRSDDLKAVLHFVRQRHPNGPIFLCGFSLGASIALLLISDDATITDLELSGAIAVCPPLDLGKSANRLQIGFNRVYDQLFAKALWRSLLERPNAVRQMGSRMPKHRPPTLKAFDEQVTAPLGGFESAAEYYSRFSTKPLVRNIKVPTLVIMAKDDPLISYEIAEQTEWSPAMKVVSTDSGGHLGFIGRSEGTPETTGIRWVEQTMIHAIRRQLELS